MKQIRTNTLIYIAIINKLRGHNEIDNEIKAISYLYFRNHLLNRHFDLPRGIKL